MFSNTPGQNPKAKLPIHSFLPADVKGSWKTAFYVDRKERQVPKTSQVTCHSSLSDTLETRSSSCHNAQTTLCSSTTSYHSQSRLSRIVQKSSSDFYTFLVGLAIIQQNPTDFSTRNLSPTPGSTERPNPLGGH